MLYWLYRHLDINIFKYTTVRAGMAFFISFVLAVWLMPKFIMWAKNKKASQPIYSLAPSSHQAKNNTPTMGGLVFLFSTLVASILTAKLNNVYVFAGLATIILFGLIGLKDDFSKISGKKNEAGLKPRVKLLLQCVCGVIIAGIIYCNTTLSTDLYLPFYKYPVADLSYFIIFFWMLVMVSSSNAVNLTDGLDGLATVPSILSLLSLSIFVYLSGHIKLSTYLFLPSISGANEIFIVIAALIGSLVGFLWYNCYPAEVFMGDSGSLSIGAFIGFSAIISKNEFLLILIGFVFVIETLSVIIQIGSFKTRKKRIFLMAPLHHHFEVKGWSENKVIVRFWIIALLSNLLALSSLKIR